MVCASASHTRSNHATFFACIFSSLKIYIGDLEGAAMVIQNFFGHQFMDQIGRNGEQVSPATRVLCSWILQLKPFEAVRTRSYHYRCFNLEALMVLSDSLATTMSSLPV